MRWLLLVELLAPMTLAVLPAFAANICARALLWGDCLTEDAEELQFEGVARSRCLTFSGKGTGVCLGRDETAGSG